MKKKRSLWERYKRWRRYSKIKDWRSWVDDYIYTYIKLEECIQSGIIEGESITVTGRRISRLTRKLYDLDICQPEYMGGWNPYHK